MHRLFFVEDTARLTSDECGIILRQQRLGVKTHILDKQWAVSQNCLRFFAVEKKSSAFAWEIEISHGDTRKINRVVATVNHEAIAKYLALRQKVFGAAKEIKEDDVKRHLEAATALAKKKRRED
jgi:hypothetical protein